MQYIQYNNKENINNNLKNKRENENKNKKNLIKNNNKKLELKENTYIWNMQYN